MIALAISFCRVHGRASCVRWAPWLYSHILAW